MGPIVRWSACDDAVVVVGKALGLHQCLLTASRAAPEIRMAGHPLVVSSDNLFGLNRHQVRSAPSPICPFLRMSNESVSILSPPMVGSHVSVRNSVPAPQPVC